MCVLGLWLKLFSLVSNRWSLAILCLCITPTLSFKPYFKDKVELGIIQLIGFDPCIYNIIFTLKHSIAIIGHKYHHDFIANMDNHLLLIAKIHISFSIQYPMLGLTFSFILYVVFQNQFGCWSAMASVSPPFIICLAS